MEKEIVICDECGSEYFKDTSTMTFICPECSHILYGYHNCNHIFKNERCINCFWDGSRSEYIKSLL
ncbi:hypothetical protein [Cellulosilyticum sp. ST5]|uniref:hypothetical protein n=1 Tax=Cellulosilyticum sp. ST5 TaxID=3055805 RepID=UPI0039776F98